MESTITNIILEKENFKVFYKIENDEGFLFESNNYFNGEVTAQKIRDFIQEKVIYFNDLKDKEELLKNELIE